MKDREYKNMKDSGTAVIPWALTGTFSLIFLTAAVLLYMVQCSAAYVVQDALVCAALSAQTPDLKIYSEDGELVITDLSGAKEAFMYSLKQNLALDEGFYPDLKSLYFSSEIPVSVEALDLYNVSYGQIYKTDLLKAEGKLEFLSEEGIVRDNRISEIGNLKAAISSGGKAGSSPYIVMQNGNKKEIQGTSVYARIRFGIKSYKGKTVSLETDVFTDVVSSMEE